MTSVIKLYYRDLNTAFSVLGINGRDVKYILDVEHVVLQIEDWHNVCA